MLFRYFRCRRPSLSRQAPSRSSSWTPTAKPRAWFWVRQKARRSTNSNTELLTLRLLKRASAQARSPSCAKTRPMRLRGLAVVELEQAAESLTTLHLACSDHRRLWRDALVAQALVRPFFMIMVDKFSY